MKTAFVLRFVVGAVLLGVVSAASGEEKGSEAAGKKPRKPPLEEKASPSKGAEPVPLYTNEDLERMFGPSTGSGATPPSSATAQPGQPAAARPEDEKPSDPLKAIEDEQAREADRKLRIAEAERAVAEAEARVKELEKRALALRNPFLPRPELPPEEAEAWKGLNNEERLERTEAALEEAKKALEEARARLASLR